MADREKVFDAIRNCITEPKCKDCPWEECEKIGCKRTKVPVTLLLDTLNLLKEQPKWISVEDGLPEVGKVVLAFGTRSATTGMFQGVSNSKRNDLWWWKGHTIKHVSHWMPLPEPPEVKQNGET